MTEDAARRKVVVLYLSRPDDSLHTHEGTTLVAVADAIARLKHYRFAGRWDESHRQSGRIFFVPDETLLAPEARQLGIGSADDLFGGVVPYSFVRTKAITHSLVGGNAERPEGWSDVFAGRIRDVVLPGYTAFSVRDAEQAAAVLLADGCVRVKKPLASGGRGQQRFQTSAELTAALEKLPADELREYGLVLETDLADVATLSIGQVTLDDMTMTYHGTQRLTTDNEGRSAYGGSDLVCVRGGWNALDRLPLPHDIRHGVAQAKVYDEATCEYPGFMASRRNYDVGQGLDSQGRWRSGVFEASWRVGGATAAEVAALAAFMEDAAVDVINASSVVAFGEEIEPPPGARVHFQGDDPKLGPMIQYSLVARVVRRAT